MPPVRPIYSLDEPLTEKIRRVAQEIYGADDVSIISALRRHNTLTGWTLHVTGALLSPGAGFVVVVTGNKMVMPKVFRAASMDVDDSERVINFRIVVLSF